MSDAGEDAAYYAEIGRHCRRRLLGVYLAAGAAVLMLVGVAYSQQMMHGAGWSAAEGTIVEVGKDASNGETTMTSEFVDASGRKHRDRQTAGYHYAPGEPQLGQRIEYLYKDSGYTGEPMVTPRADRILQWMFGIPAAIFVLMTAITGWLVLRQRNFRRWLVSNGKRERGEQYAIAHRAVPFVTGAGGSSVRMWRLDARYFEPTRFEFVDCHSDWQTAPEPEPPELRPDLELPPILFDPAKPSRYWLPVGALAPRR
jgi:hypothetical protein